jgi:hypothetical protein
VVRIIQDHLSTLVGQSSDTPSRRWWDYVQFYGIPLVLAGVAYVAQVRIRGADGILAGVSIYTALLFGLIVHVFTLGLRISDDPDTSRGDRLSLLIDELEKNVGYSVLIGIVTTAVLIFAIATTEDGHALGGIISAITIFFLCHLLLTIFMILKRTHAAYQVLRGEE